MEKDDIDKESVSNLSLHDDGIIDEFDYLNDTNEPPLESSIIADVEKCYREIATVYEKTIVKAGEVCNKMFNFIFFICICFIILDNYELIFLYSIKTFLLIFT